MALFDSPFRATDPEPEPEPVSFDFPSVNADNTAYDASAAPSLVEETEPVEEPTPVSETEPEPADSQPVDNGEQTGDKQTRKTKRGVDLSKLNAQNIQTVVDLYQYINTDTGMKLAQVLLDTSAHNTANLTEQVLDAKTQKRVEPFIKALTPLSADGADSLTRIADLSLMAGENTDNLYMLLRVLRLIAPDKTWAASTKAPRDIALNIARTWDDSIDLSGVQLFLMK
ncbi:hypothetical protein GCM10007377_15650 [Galliscardovia ingluviei]|uniref:Uncharacterized protein n=1 Tax=Galliscardovia ingluviei TaxID=1769422 RepID=A0A8J3AJ49_9BIFI|nr:hypothetical protein [Galliscardovia ingluviei]GGI15388.1 hypothetical protein GCM10007377_15650 [Galliscardovia ingluviei]